MKKVERVQHRATKVIPELKEMEHVPNIFMSFHKYLFLEVINIFI